MLDFHPSTSRSRLLKRLALLSALSPTLFPSRAEAQDIPRDWALGAGAFVGLSFGKEIGIAYGVEAFATRFFEPAVCYNDAPRVGVGPLAQVKMVGLAADPRVTLGLHGGSEVERAGYALTGEVGGTYRFGPSPGFGLHLGFSNEWAIFDVAIRSELLLSESSLVAGERYLPMYGDPGRCSIAIAIGRPLRSETGFVEIETRGHRAPPRGSRPPRRTASTEAAGAAWESDAQHECASVPAFLQLARELMAHDAPLSLIERALDAACDEILHARLCAGMATRLLGVSVWPTLPDSRSRPVPSVTRLAEESWLDGCLGEGAAARRAGRGARIARDRRATAIQTRIERDETRHTELGWEVLRWAVARGGAKARDAVQALRHVEIPAAEGAPSDGREDYGQLSAPEAHAISTSHAQRCVHRMDHLMESAR